MHVSLYEEKSNKSGMTSVILHTVVNGNRSKRALGIYFKTNPQTESEKKDKKEKLLIAKKIANLETSRLLNGEYLLQEQFKTSEDFVAYAEQFIEQHPVKDKRKYICGLNYLKQYLGKSRIPCFEITEVVLQRFAKYLEQRLNGETAFGYFSKLKQIITAATDDLYFRKNPASKVKVRQHSYRQYEALTTDELRALHHTPIGNIEVKRAFLFASRTGLRWVDIKQLRWEHIKNNTVILRQAKTGVSVSIPLDKDSLELLGEGQAKTQLVFTLPSHTGALKWLKKWAEAAGVEKHIGFHTARRTFGTSLITYGSDVSIVSKLLGHTSLRLTKGNKEYSTLTDIIGIVIIDELELHLHPKYQSILPKLFSDIFPNVLFIVSTHSPIPLLGMPDETVLLRVDRTEGKGVTIRRLSQMEKQIKELLPDTLLTSAIFNFDYLEDLTEEQFNKLTLEDNFDDIEKGRQIEERLKNIDPNIFPDKLFDEN